MRDRWHSWSTIALFAIVVRASLFYFCVCLLDSHVLLDRSPILLGCSANQHNFPTSHPHSSTTWLRSKSVFGITPFNQSWLQVALATLLAGGSAVRLPTMQPGCCRSLSRTCQAQSQAHSPVQCPGHKVFFSQGSFCDSDLITW